MGQGGAVLVTGAARRIGRAIVDRLAQDGCAVIIHASARSLHEAEALASDISARVAVGRAFVGVPPARAT